MHYVLRVNLLEAVRDLDHELLNVGFTERLIYLLFKVVVHASSGHILRYDVVGLIVFERLNKFEDVWTVFLV